MPEHTVQTLAEQTLAGLAEATGYSPEKEGSVDDLIAYKDALEDELREALNEVQTLRMSDAEKKVLGGFIHWPLDEHELVFAKEQVWESLGKRFDKPAENAFDED